MGAWAVFDRLGADLIGRQFIGGTGIEEVLRKGAFLKRQGFQVTYNLLGEHIQNAARVQKAIGTTLQLLDEMNPEDAGNISCKPTLYGLVISQEVFYESIKMMLPRAMKAGIELEIDAESTEYIPATFEVFSRFADEPRYRHSIRQAVQAHRTNIFELLHRYGMPDKRLRIVKGSGVYAEEEAASLSQDMVALQYLALMRENIHTGQVPYAATVRDRLLAKEVIDVVCGNRSSVEFEMLYGPLGRKLGQDLLRRGYRVRIYIPFVAEWFADAWKPYGLRRSAMMRRLFLQEAASRLRGRV